MDILRTEAPHSGLAITAIGPLTPAQALTIHNLAKYEVLGARYTSDEDENGADAGQPVSGWEPDEPFTAGRWTTVRDAFIAGGIAASVVDTWKTNNPNGTPRDVYRALGNYVGGAISTSAEGEV